MERNVSKVNAAVIAAIADTVWPREFAANQSHSPLNRKVAIHKNVFMCHSETPIFTTNSHFTVTSNNETHFRHLLAAFFHRFPRRDDVPASSSHKP
jgi:hypothetical protein